MKQLKYLPTFNNIILFEMKNISIGILLFLFSYLTSFGQSITTFTLDSGVTSTTLTAPMSPGDSVILISGSLPPGCTVAITSYTTVLVFNTYEKVFNLNTNANNNNQFMITSAYTRSAICVISNAMVGMNIVCYDNNGVPILNWLLLNSNIVTGIAELNSLKFNPIIFPNPINDVFAIGIKDQNASSFEFNLYNNFGELVLHKNDINSSESNNINIANVSPGVYTLEILYDNKRSLQKIVKM